MSVAMGVLLALLAASSCVAAGSAADSDTAGTARRQAHHAQGRQGACSGRKRRPVAAGELCRRACMP
jgi:hypothetical protein